MKKTPTRVAVSAGRRLFPIPFVRSIIDGAKKRLFEPFLYNYDQFTKTGLGQT
jgi:hypothetical protein